MAEMAPRQSNEWTEFHESRLAGTYPKWPNEAMLKVVFGSYAQHRPRPTPEWRVLDVGCGFGNNLAPFADLGCECHGVEISDEIAALAERAIAERGYRASIRKGSNRALPYPDNHFDLLLSLNTLHYEGESDAVGDALREFRRVLKPGGALYLSTVGPGHAIQERAENLGDHRYRIRNYDFRDGQIFYFFDTEAFLGETCLEVFDRVETGHVTEKLMTLRIDFLIALCQ